MTWEQAKNAMIREFGFECEATIALLEMQSNLAS